MTGNWFAVVLLALALLSQGPGMAGTGRDASEASLLPVSAGPPGAQPVPGPPRAALPGSGTYQGLALGDLDRDADMDLVAAGEGGIEVWDGDGAGSWVARTAPAGQGRFAAVAISDLDHDGGVDLVAAGEEGVGCWDGSGAWGWTPGTDPIDSGQYRCVEIGDVNMDGNPDIIAGGAGGIRLRLGDGKGGWAAGADPASAGTWYGLAFGDFNLDGKPDIAACGNSSAMENGTVSIFIGDGSGDWPSTVPIAADLPGPVYSLKSADVNRDGRPDLVGAGMGGIHYWTGDGSGGWAPGAAPSSELDHRALILGDLNHDGKVDIVTGNENGASAWLGDGGSGWPQAAARPLHNMTVLGLAAGDLNHDARPDIVAATAGKGVEAWLSDTPSVKVAGWSAASTGLQNSGKWADIDFGDVDNDGDLDLAVTSYQNQNRGIKAYLGDGRGCWTESSAGLPAAGSCSGVRFADLDHDGNLDIAATTDAGTAGTVGTRVWKGQGNGTWTFQGTVDTRSGAGLETGDLNNDGQADLLTGFWANAYGPMVFLGNGGFTFRPDSGPASTVNVDDVVIADANGDGKPDFAASTMDQKGIQFWTGNGTGAPASWKREDAGLPATAVYLGLAMADVNIDGNPDLAAAGYGPGNGLHVYLGDGGTGGTVDWAEASRGLPAAADFGGVELADLDLDGDIDLLAGNVSNGGLDLFWGNGGAGGSLNWTEAGMAPLPSSGNVWGVRFGDIDNDGVLDIAATPDGSGARVWKTEVAPAVYFDHVAIAPLSGKMEPGSAMEFSAQAYDAGNNPVAGIKYVWEVEGGVGTLDNSTGTRVNLTGKMEGSGKLRVVAMQGLFAKGASANITVVALPKPADVMVILALSVRPDTIWLNGTDLAGYQENATVRIGIRAVGRNLTVNDRLVLNFTLAPGVRAVEGTVAPAPNSTASNASGTTLMSWSISFIENSTTLWLSFDVMSDVPGASVPVNLPALSEVRFLNLSGPQVFLLDQLSVQVLLAKKEVPGPPLELAARPGNGFVRLSWSPPVFDGNSSIEGYRIHRGSAGGNETPLRTIGNVTEFNDTNVTNGVTYYYAVSALNGVGEGPPSDRAWARPAEEAGPPGAPRNLSGSPGNGFVVLGWEPPADDGGSEVLEYLVYRNTTAGNGTLLAEVANLTFNDTQVANGIAYYFSVAARNAVGVGEATPEINVTPEGPPVERAPSEPRNLTALAGDGYVDLDWEPPLDDGGAPVTNYRVMRGQEPGKGVILKVLGPELGFRDAGLANGRYYYYSVAAVNRVDKGPPTQEARARPWALPSAPRNLTATPVGEGTVRCSWGPPASDGGFNITGYKVYRSGAGGTGANATWEELGSVAERVFLDSTAQKGITYRYRVTALTEKGEGPPSEAVQASVPPEGKPSGGEVWMSIFLIALIIAVAVLAAVAGWRKLRKGSIP